MVSGMVKRVSVSIPIRGTAIFTIHHRSDPKYSEIINDLDAYKIPKVERILPLRILKKMDTDYANLRLRWHERGIPVKIQKEEEGVKVLLVDISKLYDFYQVLIENNMEYFDPRSIPDKYQITSIVLKEKEKIFFDNLENIGIKCAQLFNAQEYHKVKVRFSDLGKFYRVYAEQIYFNKPKHYRNPLQRRLEEFF